jgi:hypothetical protein
MSLANREGPVVPYGCSHAALGKRFSSIATDLLKMLKNVGARTGNPCRRREREATYCNSKELRGMDSTLPQLSDSRVRLLDS